MLKNVITVSFLFALSVFTIEAKQSERPALLPVPQNLTWSNESFSLKDVSVIAPDSAVPYLTRFLETTHGKSNPKSSKKIEVSFVNSISGVDNNPEEGYSLEVNSKNVRIEAITLKGLYWATQTLRQLTENKKIAGCRITDYPSFRIRGFMQDVGRSYISMDELKREIEILSRYKINVFHWHLTENQAWRLESKKFPALTDSKNMTRMPGMFYSIEEARELVEFCKTHNVMLIPEIDMPGHSEAFVRAYGHDMQSPEGMVILKSLMDEVCEIFADVPYIHIGTDEVQFTNPSFVPEMVGHIRNNGKKVISWNPGWNYKPGEIDMTQLWSSRGKAQPGIPAIDCRFHYLNHFDTFGDIVALYNSRVCNQEQGNNDYAGSILALWHDRLVEPEENVILENNFYPNMLAFAERSWLGGGSEYFDDKGTILDTDNSDSFTAFADFENRMLKHKELHFGGYPFRYVKQTNVRWNITEQFPNEGDLKRNFTPELMLKNDPDIIIPEFTSTPAVGAGIYLRHVWGTLVPGFFKDPKENHTAYAYTWVFSPKEQEAGAMIEFQNYSRSEKDLAPKTGKWDYRESRVWLNNDEILPPVWSATHTEKTNEIALGNENCVGRAPTPVKLNKGWNRILIKMPVGKFSNHEVRLQKWMFTFVLVTPDGEKALPGITYSPEKKI